MRTPGVGRPEQRRCRVARLWPRFLALPLGLLFLGVADVACLRSPAAHAWQSGVSGTKSWTESITSPLKQGFDKLGRALTPKPSAPKPSYLEDDAVSLKSTAQPGPELYVATARLCEQSGKMAEAEQQYRLALAKNPDNLNALLGYARLCDHVGKPSEAIRLYERAAKLHPREVSVHNNLGLCYAKQDRLDEAVTAMRRATELDPKNRLYRNNIATVLVDQGKLREAFDHLKKGHNAAAAYYNMGYLLNKKGHTQAAMQHFELALRTDPSMNEARRWVEYLQRTTAHAQKPRQPASTVARADDKPLAAQKVRPEAPTPQRLPPTRLRRPVIEGPTSPGVTYERPTAPAAPLPPPTTNAALRPLPRVR